MSAKDYILLAAAFARTRIVPDNDDDFIQRSQWNDDVDEIALVLKADNPRFDVARFNAACGR
jgi:hypothetical protein